MRTLNVEISLSLSTTKLTKVHSKFTASICVNQIQSYSLFLSPASAQVDIISDENAERGNLSLNLRNLRESTLKNSLYVDQIYIYVCVNQFQPYSLSHSLSLSLHLTHRHTEEDITGEKADP